MDRGAGAVAAGVHRPLRPDRAGGSTCWATRPSSCTPGPMNRGVEIAAEVADLPRSVITDQVRNGVAVRMAVLFQLLGSGQRPGRGSRPGSGSVKSMLIRGGAVVDATGERRGRRAGRRRPHRRRRQPTARRSPPTSVLDAGGCVVAPGLVDLHTHLRQPGQEEAETVETGARAAALGGFTAVRGHAQHRRPPSTRRGVAREVLELGRARVLRRARRPPSPWAARRAAGAHGRAGRARRALLHRRRQRRAGRPAHAPGPGVRRGGLGVDAGPALRGRGAGRRRAMHEGAWSCAPRHPRPAGRRPRS